jgi:hypothetical protein
MSRGQLGDVVLAELSKKLPDLESLSETILTLSPVFVSMRFPPESTIPVAAVCLHDALNTLYEARYALHEVLAHRVWYLEKREPPDENAAVFFTRFYADDVALSLYAAGEHLANAIVSMLEIEKRSLVPYAKKRISKQVAVGKFLSNEHPHHAVAKAVRRLTESKEWLETINYRNTWVHSKPPIIKGRGI